MESQLERMVDGFETNPWGAGKVLRELVRTGDDAFAERALALIKTAPDGPGNNYLLTLLSADVVFLVKLCDPAVISASEAAGIARRIQRLDPHFDVRVLRYIVAGSIGGASNGKAAERLLEMMSAVSDISRTLPLLSQLLRHENARIRSKAVLLAGRAGMGAQLAKKCMAHEDKRVRANAVEALWENPAHDARGILYEAASDSDNRVAANAVMGLYKLGDTTRIGWSKRWPRTLLPLSAHRPCGLSRKRVIHGSCRC